MAKMTLSNIASAMATYVDSANIAGTYSPTYNNFGSLLDKIGKMITIDGLYNDKLTEMDGEDLPLGKTIEEWFMDLTLPTAYSNITAEGAKDIVPALPTVEDAFYSYTLGRQKIKTTVPYDNFERAMLTSADSGNFGAKILERLQNSYDITKYNIKKQLIGRFSDAVYAVNKKVMDKPVDTTTGEAFLKDVKAACEEASFANEKSLTSGAVIGVAPSLTLYLKTGIMPSVEVDVLAGAFNPEKLGLPANVTVKIVDGFGTQTNTGVYALLCDSRAMKVYNGYNALRTSPNADGDFLNFVKHFELTAFYSKYAYGKVWSAT